MPIKLFDYSNPQNNVPTEVKVTPPSVGDSTQPTMLSGSKSIKAFDYAPAAPKQSFVQTVFPNTAKDLEELKLDPLSLKAKPSNALHDAVDVFKGSWNGLEQKWDEYKKASQGYEQSHGTPHVGFAGKLGATLSLVGAGAGVVFSPISALFAAGEDIPALGSVTKIINTAFTAAGEGGKAIGYKVIDELPIKNQEDKAKLKEGVGEIFSLAAQFALGKASEVATKSVLPNERAATSFRKEVADAYPHAAPEVSTLPTKTITKLIKTYGVEDAGTIVSEASKLARSRAEIGDMPFGQALDMISKSKVSRETAPIEPVVPEKPAGLGQEGGKAAIPEPTLPETPKFENPAPKAKIERPADAAEATQRFYDEVLKPKLEKGEATVIGADDMKDFFSNDYADARHREVYSKATFDAYKRLLKANDNKEVALTGGGAGSGKTELVTKNLIGDGFKGTVYDSNLSSIEGAKNAISEARKAGKNVEIYGVLPDLERARGHTITREGVTGRGVSDETFARGHAGFPEVVRQLIEDGIIAPEKVHLLDTRGVNTWENAVDLMRSNEFVKDPLATVKSLGYSKEDILKNHGRENYTNTGERKGVVPENEKPDRTSSQNRADQKASNGSGADRVLEQNKGREKLEPVGEGQTRVSKLAKGIEQKAIEKKLTDGFNGLPDYKQANLKEQARLASEFLKDDPARAFEVAMGNERAPEGVLPEMILKAIEDAALEKGDVATIEQLAHSHLTTEATAMGQRIRALAERNPDSPVAAIQRVIKAREKGAKLEGRTASEARAGVVEDIKKEVAKKAPKKQDWKSFVDSITC